MLLCRLFWYLWWIWWYYKPQTSSKCVAVTYQSKTSYSIWNCCIFVTLLNPKCVRLYFKRITIPFLFDCSVGKWPKLEITAANSCQTCVTLWFEALWKQLSHLMILGGWWRCQSLHFHHELHHHHKDMAASSPLSSRIEWWFSPATKEQWPLVINSLNICKCVQGATFHRILSRLMGNQTPILRCNSTGPVGTKVSVRLKHQL